MATPRYSITLRCGSAKISYKLKTVLGDVEGLERELAHLLEKNQFKSLSEALATKYGGLEKTRERWHDEYMIMVGSCDVCGGTLDGEYKTITTSNLAGVVTCSKCCQKSG